MSTSSPNSSNAPNAASSPTFHEPVRSTTIDQRFATVRVLVYDENVWTRDLLRVLLVRRGFQVSVSSDFAEAAGLAERGEIDILVTDYVEPDGKKGQMLQCLRCTAGGSGTGTFELVRKPLDVEDLVSALGRLLEPAHPGMSGSGLPEIFPEDPESRDRRPGAPAGIVREPLYVVFEESPEWQPAELPRRATIRKGLPAPRITVPVRIEDVEAVMQSRA